MSRRRARFEDLGLTRNPFGECDRVERVGLARVDLGDLPAFLRGPRRCVQFVADHGRGKSTHLLALHGRHFAGCSYLKLGPGARPPRPAPPWPLFVDSFENLGRWGRRSLYRRAESLALTTHRDLAPELARAGYAVRTVHVGIGGLGELDAIVRARVEAARLDERAPFPARGRLAELHRRLGDDVRAIEHELYLDYQGLRDDASGAPADADAPFAPPLPARAPRAHT